MLAPYFDVIYNAMLNFNENIFLPLFEKFDLRTLLFLLLGVVLVVRFLLMPLIGISPFSFDFTGKSDTAQMPRRQQIGIEQKTLRIEQKG